MSGSPVRFGEADLSTCDREPIHIPGSIQPHGVLLVLDRESLTIEQVAGPTEVLLRVVPAAVLGAALIDLIDTDSASFVRSHLATPARFLAPLTRLGVRAQSDPEQLDMTLHAQGRTAMIELERARRTKSSAADPIAELKTLLAAVQATASIDDSCAAAASALRAATGFDRAMVYRFQPDQSGVIVAEDARAGLESYLGLHYPASDIPQQARELYRRNWLRSIADVDYVPAPLIPATNPRSRQPIDMSHCSLRSVSPIHIEYLRNMGVSASMSASIICRDQLWGMLVLHHYSPRLLSADLRIACETFAQIFSLHVEAKIQAEDSVARLEARQLREELTNALGAGQDIGRAIAAWDLCRYLSASGAAVYIDGRMHRVGETPASHELESLVHWLNGINQPLYATEHLAAQYPQAARFPGLASGLVAVGISREPRDYVLWFRPEFGRTVRWAGDPASSIKTGPLGVRLTPRGSFSEWLEVTRMQSAPWSEMDLEAAEALRVVLLESLLRSVDLARREQAFEKARAVAEQLERRVAERTEKLQALVSDLEAAEERERLQIARDLHDDLGQMLAAARIRLAGLCNHADEGVRQIATGVAALIDRASDSTRSVAAQLAPAVLHELGLCPALEWLGEEIERTFGLRVTTTTVGKSQALMHDSRSILYRAVRELLINVAKHARTDSATVEIEWQPRRVLVRVSDRGIGYDTARIFDWPHRGLGLITLRERLSLIGGAVEFQSAAGAGTVALLSAPLADTVSPSDEPGE